MIYQLGFKRLRFGGRRMEMSLLLHPDILWLHFHLLILPILTVIVLLFSSLLY